MLPIQAKDIFSFPFSLKLEDEYVLNGEQFVLRFF